MRKGGKGGDEIRDVGLKWGGSCYVRDGQQSGGRQQQTILLAAGLKHDQVSQVATLGAHRPPSVGFRRTLNLYRAKDPLSIVFPG